LLATASRLSTEEQMGTLYWQLFECAILLFILFGLYRFNQWLAKWITKWNAKQKKKSELLDRNMGSAIRATIEVLLLPSINTQWLIKAPDSWLRNQRIDFFWEGTFNVRGSFIVIVDRQLNVWLGFITAGTIQSLLNAEYCPGTISIPICGQRQAFAGPNVKTSGKLFEVYPRWFYKETSPEDWARWAELEDMYKSQPDFTTHDLYQILNNKKLWEKNISKKAERDEKRRRALEPPEI